MKTLINILIGLVICAATLSPPIQASQGQTVRYQHTDMLGTPVMETDESGYVISRSVYEPFGKRLGGEKAGIGFTGHLQDEDLGLTYMQARYYDPVIGRFYSNDPVGYTSANPVMSFNRYLYVNNNPYKYTDPDGEFIFLAIAAISIGITAYDTYQTYQSEGAGAAAQTLAIGGAISLAGGGALKLAGKAIKGIRSAMKACCFVAGTQVLTEDGYKNIEDVKLGEKLWAKNVDTGEQEWKAVTKIFNEPDRGIYEIKLHGNDGFEQKIEATDDHPFYVIGKGWKTTIELKVGDEIETDGNGAMKVISVVDEQRQALTYNFTVADFHTYYVTKKNVLVHNCDLQMKSGGLGESTKGSFDSVKNTANQIANSGDSAAKACAACKLKTSLKTRRADQKRQVNKNTKTYQDHKNRINMEQKALDKLEKS